MHCRELRTATFRLVARHRTMAWQSDPRRLVSAPTCSVYTLLSSAGMLSHMSSSKWKWCLR